MSASHSARWLLLFMMWSLHKCTRTHRRPPSERQDHLTRRTHRILSSVVALRKNWYLSIGDVAERNSRATSCRRQRNQKTGVTRQTKTDLAHDDAGVAGLDAEALENVAHHVRLARNDLACQPARTQ